MRLSNWGKVHSAVLSKFLDRLNQEKIDWLIIRNQEGLPEENHSKDVDIAIAKPNWTRADKILLDAFKQFGFQYYVLNKFQFIHCYLFINVNEQISFKIDFFDCNEYKGLVTHSFQFLNQHKIQTDNGLYATNPLHAALIIWMRPLLGGAYIKKKYIPEILDCYEKDKQSFKFELIRLVGIKIADELIPYFETHQVEDTLRYRKKLIWKLFSKSFKNNPLRTVNYIFKHYLSSLLTKVAPIFAKSDFIAVEGADGTGKSTFIEGMQKAIAYYYVSDDSKCHIYHHRPSILPNLGVLGEKAGIKEQDKDFTNPHRGKPKGFVSSLVRMCYYWIDYLIGVPILMRKDVQFDKFTIYDRYVYDFLVDPYRTSIQLPYWLRKVFTKLVIQPRIVFVLLTDAETIYQRKQELTIEEINRQLEEFSKLAKSNKRFVVIDAALFPNEMVDKAISITIEKFTEKIN